MNTEINRYGTSVNETSDSKNQRNLGELKSNKETQISSIASDRIQKAVRRVRWLARVFDDQFRIPGTDYRFGLDGILGLVPIAGDLVTGVVSLYLVFEGWRMGMPWRKLFRMGINVVFDVLIGAVPLVGDVFDISWKVNQKNVQMMLRYLERNS